MSIEDRIETARHSYDAARTESLERMQQRYQTLVIYLTFIGLIFSVAYGRDTTHEEILLIVPFVGLGIALFVAQHHIMTVQLGNFCTIELSKSFLKGLDGDAPHWDDSKIFSKFARDSARLRFGGHLLVIVAPSLLALLAWFLGIISKITSCENSNNLFSNLFSDRLYLCEDLPNQYHMWGQFLLWLTGWLFVFFTINILNYSHKKRMDNYDHRWSIDVPSNVDIPIKYEHNFFREIWIFIKFLFRGDFNNENKGKESSK